jgi:hypothetical protein
MTGYASWYGTSVGSPEEGYAYRLKGELWGYLNVDLEHLLVHEARDVGSSASCAPLYYKGTDGIYTVTSATTTLDGLQSSVVMTNATELSTQDSGPSTVCTQSPSYAVPWFYSYCCTTCPTFMGGYWTDEPHPMASYIASSPDLYGQVEASVCPSGAALYGAGYAGINSMEYYIR